MSKEIIYTTIEEQLKKLKSQNLTIMNEDLACKRLAMYGYSNLIKSYREPYIIRTEDTIVYRNGVSLDQIHSLYLLDKNLRNSVMAAMQDLEEHIKESAASVIAESFGVDQCNYLKYKNYYNKKKRKERFTLPAILDTLKNTLNTDKNPIHHYSVKYDMVPPWILLKSIYFSTMVNFIDLFKDNEQTKLVERLYDTEAIKLDNEQLCKLMMDTLFICLDYRNVAAHGGRTYNHKSKYHMRYREIFNIDKSIIPHGFSELLFLLKFFNYQRPYDVLNETLQCEITRHCNLYPNDVTYLGQILNIDIVQQDIVYVSEKTKKYHYNPHCSGIKSPKEMPLEDVKNIGYSPCKRCCN